MLCAGITVARHCGEEALVDRHQLESLEFASGEHERGEVDGVQDAQLKTPVEGPAVLWVSGL
ncbi:MAG: hypothetical protein DMD96_03995 [Candidatus Rokuibacteriota bacterium]|nr:MAG: hypothetical protein DMD96_03995 [Candidatus Rokubacteria bacterium]